MENKYPMAENDDSFLVRQLKRLSLDVIILVSLFIICIWILFAVADMVFEDNNFSIDERVFAWLTQFTNKTNTGVMSAITFFGSHRFLVPANLALASVFLFFKNHRLYSIKIVAVSLTSTAVLFFLKSWLQRERPLIPLISKVHGYSFPSGHTFSSIVFFGMIIFLIHRTIKNKLLKWVLTIVIAVFTLLIGFSRIYLRLHYTSDVIAGICLGIIWLLLANWLLLKTDKIVEETHVIK